MAVALHEIPQELGDFGILLHSGFTKRRALLYNFSSALLAILGAVVALLVGQRVDEFGELAIPFTAGGFVYIALSGLIPELHRESNIGKSLLQFISIVAGISVMASLLLLE
ncbi:MAG: zinc transporter ZupT [bacterium ADurb.Bin400]|nr:MAG: zinc transporter ZupT [bacterium ADurb.Bin400]